MTRREHVTLSEFERGVADLRERESTAFSRQRNPGEARLDHRRATGSISRKRMTNGNSESFSSQPTPTSQSTTSTEHRVRKGKGSGYLPGMPSPKPRSALSLTRTLQRASLLRSQGFTPDNNQELSNLLRFISTLQSQQAQQNGMFLSLYSLVLLIHPS